MPDNETHSLGKPDQALLGTFRERIESKVPHWEEGAEQRRVINPTPLVDITKELIACAKAEYGTDISKTRARVLGKFDSEVFGGSIKVRPAVEIIRDAISTGKLRKGQVVFEATSGNFGLALGMLRDLGIEVVNLVSRKLQDGVKQELLSRGAKTIDLDVDICPAPGLQIDQNVLVAKTVALNMRQQLVEQGLDALVFDRSKAGIEQYLARQDVIGLAKYLATIYNGFCPEQYDNPLNVKVHETLTGPEIDKQLFELGSHPLADYKLVCTFGTGGTSTGLANYVEKKYSKRIVHVIFPLGNQDVAGIRTREKSLGLRFYDPSMYAGEHEVDFNAAKRLFRYFAGKGYDIGESSALALYATLQMINYGAGDKFIVIFADGL
ncbi:MAG TPA: pyridoxal-phosphate dependent enzyme, partial [Candidatus Binatus sp.]|nr:pyridoxal-phosphate dependent enzyme [Candidatus Binatus sp.]